MYSLRNISGKNNTKPQICTYAALKSRNKEYHSIAGYGTFQTHLRVWIMLIVEDPNMTLICKAAMKASCFLHYITERLLKVALSTIILALITLTC
jgi:hypothetical protein